MKEKENSVNYNVELNNVTDYGLDESRLKEFTKGVLNKESAPQGSLSIAFLGKNKMKAVHEEYLDSREATNVLAFETGELGEILICPLVVEKEAENLDSNFSTHLRRMIVHGVLHLLGHTHQAEEEKQAMLARQEELLSG